MTRNIGEIFELDGEWYQCIESDSCGECSFFTTECGSGTKSDLADKVAGQCSKIRRTDNKHVIFKKIEKVGEPYEHYGKLYQCYKLLVEIEIRLLPNNCYPIGKDNLVEIEIKQKEDMEDKKLNPKPFDIQKAREGKPVCTRDGRNARIICFDCKDETFQIVALVSGSLGKEEIISYDKAGHSTTRDRDEMLMMLPEKKEGWVNVYKDGCLLSARVYKTRKEAYDNASPCDYVDTVKIEWEE